MPEPAERTDAPTPDPVVPVTDSGSVAGPVPDALRPPAGTGPPLGDAHLRRPLQRRGEQRALPAQPRQGADRSVGRLRPAHPDRLRPRPRRWPAARSARSACRSRTSATCGALFDEHPARPDEHLHDDQRHRDVAARDVRGGGRGAGARRRASTRPRRCTHWPARPRTTSSRSTCRAAPTCSRPSPRCG